MKPLLFKIRAEHAPGADRATTDDNLGRGMDIALTMLVFLVFGWLLDRWLGTWPVFTVALVVVAAVGAFIRMKYTYDASMERLEAARRDRAAARGTTMEDAA